MYDRFEQRTVFISMWSWNRRIMQYVSHSGGPLLYPRRPASLVFAFWFGGAYLMAVKRYAEYRTLGDPEIARQYRRSFGNYTESTLSALFYAMNSAFFIGIFLIKYRIEFLLTFPLLALVFSWYFAIGMQPNSVAQTPELLYRHRTFLLYILLVIVCFSFLSVFDIPGLHFLLNRVLRGRL